MKSRKRSRLYISHHIATARRCKSQMSRTLWFNIGTQWYSNTCNALPFPFPFPSSPPASDVRSRYEVARIHSPIFLSASRSVSLRRIWPPYTSSSLLGRSRPTDCLLLLKSRNTRVVSSRSLISRRGRLLSSSPIILVLRLDEGWRKIASRDSFASLSQSVAAAIGTQGVERFLSN